MKKAIFFPIFLIFFLSGYAQNGAKLDSTVSITSTNKVGRKPHQDMLLVDLNWDRLVGLNPGATQKWYGRGIAASLMFDYPLRNDGRISVAGGGGIASHNYYTNALLTKIDSTNQAYFMPVSTTIRKRGKISVNYVDVPLEIRFRTAENKKGERWKLAVGARVGYRINVHEKIIDANDRKMKTYYYPQVGLFRYGATMRVGYGAVMMTAFYSISPLFDAGVGLTQMNSFSLGLTITPF